MDETWIHHYIKESKRQSSEWTATDEKRPKLARVGLGDYNNPIVIITEYRISTHGDLKDDDCISHLMHYLNTMLDALVKHWYCRLYHLESHG
ncbi:hypothetical protein O3G_MSEX006579 [Manduca sexta]|uniref:Uncharacterized protein n=1 Tax=Manduca sexta TaxID=7130 RepID=A0A922CLG3_MANSE|nr:hypothetical protein O3G_MSEX006579 [Manduca sexta]